MYIMFQDKSLKLHARMFSSSQHSMNREVYTSLGKGPTILNVIMHMHSSYFNKGILISVLQYSVDMHCHLHTTRYYLCFLVEHLNMQFTYKGQKGDLKTGLDVTSPSACRLLRRVRVQTENVFLLLQWWSLKALQYLHIILSTWDWDHASTHFIP